MTRLLFFAVVGVLAGCSATEPVVVITQNGQTLRGSATATLSGGSFYATDGRLRCGGEYDGLSMEVTITMPVHCSDGRKGIVIATRDSGRRSGHGVVRLNDGTQGTFIFGPSAARY